MVSRADLPPCCLRCQATITSYTPIGTGDVHSIVGHRCVHNRWTAGDERHGGHGAFRRAGLREEPERKGRDSADDQKPNSSEHLLNHAAVLLPQVLLCFPADELGHVAKAPDYEVEPEEEECER